MPLSIILVEPETPENIGFIARTMNCYKQTDLRFIGTRKLLPMSKAYKTGTKGKRILSKAQYYSSLEESLHDIHLALGFTRRKRSIQDRRVTDISETIASTSFHPKVALVFGKESKGLTQSDCRLMDKLVYIDLPDSTTCFNLSHCVTVVLHEIYYHTIKANNPLRSINNTQHLIEKPTIGQKNQILDSFLKILKKEKFFKQEKEEAHFHYLQDLWNRASPNQTEMDFLIGIFKKLTKKKK